MGYPKKHRGRRKIGSRKRRAKRRAKKLKKKEETAFLSKEIDVSYSATILVQGKV